MYFYHGKNIMLDRKAKRDHRGIKAIHTRIDAAEKEVASLDNKVDVRMDSLRKEILAKFEAMDVKVDSKFEAEGRRFDAMDFRFDALEAKEKMAEFEVWLAEIEKKVTTSSARFVNPFVFIYLYSSL